MTCQPTSIVDPDRCPSVDAMVPQLVALLPRGRAWSTDINSTIWKFWRAVATVFAELERRICDLRDEFWCATQSETRPEWLADYGLPDVCDAYPDLCSKVAAIGGATCTYLAAIAARAGWSIACIEASAGLCGMVMGRGQVGCTGMGMGATAGTLLIEVQLGDSPAYTAPVAGVARMGCFQMGRPLGCGPDVTPLRCLLQRIAPAHLVLAFRLVQPPQYLAASDIDLVATDTGAAILART